MKESTVLRIIAWALIIFGAIRCLPLMFFFIIPYALADQAEEREKRKSTQKSDSSKRSSEDQHE